MGSLSRENIFHLTRAPLGHSAERAPLGGGAYSASLSNSRTSRPSETGEVAIESSRQYDAKECLKFFIQGQDHGFKAMSKVKQRVSDHWLW